MHSGVVSVTGPVSGGEIFVVAGRRCLSAFMTTAARSRRATPLRHAREPGPAAPVATQANGAVERGAECTGRISSGLDWTAKLADGQAAAIVADATRRGIAQVLTASNSEEIRPWRTPHGSNETKGWPDARYSPNGKGSPGADARPRPPSCWGASMIARTTARRARSPGMTAISTKRPPARTCRRLWAGK